MKNTHGRVFLLVKLQTKSNTLPWVFFTFFKLHKWQQIAQNIAYVKMQGLTQATKEFSEEKR